MCGRYTYILTWEEIHRLSGAIVPAGNLAPSYNVAPTQRNPVVRVVNGEVRADILKWGLIPSWAKDAKIAASLTNARSETVEAKPSFKGAFKSRRCLVPASGFFEWRRPERNIKEPYYITGSRGPIFFAGLWERWGKEEVIDTYTILTTSANGLMAPIHDRMPVILEPQSFGRWLDKESEVEELKDLLVPCGDSLLSTFRVSDFVNNARNNQESCIQPL